MAEPDQRRRTIGPVVLLGLASGGLAAVAGNKPWVTGVGGEPFPGGMSSTFAQVSSSPLATALALVVLACWGVVLVTRARFRRAVAWLGVVAALGHAATVAAAPFSLPGHLVEQVREQTGTELGATTLTSWFWIAVVAAPLVVAATVAGALLVRHWPEMGSKYDAPAGARPATDTRADEPPTENIDIWKAIDEGRDPTA
jgi:uncharacterized membrane protein (TIGR02234 family)